MGKTEAFFVCIYSLTRIKRIKVHSTFADFYQHVEYRFRAYLRFFPLFQLLIDVNIHAFMAFLHTYFDYCKTWSEFWFSLRWMKPEAMESVALNWRCTDDRKKKRVYKLLRMKHESPIVEKRHTNSPNGTLWELYDAWIVRPKTSNDRLALMIKWHKVEEVC